MATSIVEDVRRPGRITDLVRWGPVVAGVVIALGFFALMNVLWLALAYSVDGSDGTGWISGNLGWFIGVTAAVALMLSGFLAGFFSGPRGAAAGAANGLTAWGLLFVLSLTAIVPGALNLTEQLGAGLQGGQTAVGGPLGAAGSGFTVESRCGSASGRSWQVWCWPRSGACSAARCGARWWRPSAPAGTRSRGPSQRDRRRPRGPR